MCMKNTIIIKLLLILLTIFSMALIGGQRVYATSWIQGADDFISDGESSSDSTAIDTDDMQEMSNMLYNAFLIIGIIIAVIIGLVIGIKFMTGSVAEKAEVKKTLVPYIAGCIVIFGAFTIWRMVINLLNNV